MCTVSLVSHDTGFRLVCNRDERIDRPPAGPPRLVHINGQAATMPFDPQGGGTWIGASDLGLVMVVLNRYADRAMTHERRGRSRGAIIPFLISCRSVAEAAHAMTRFDVSEVAPFRLLMVQAGIVSVAVSDGLRMSSTTRRLTRPLVLASSSLGDACVEPIRQTLFAELLATYDEPLLAQAAFHRHRWPTRTDISVLMTRLDARTVSRTVVDVTRHTATMQYEELGPELVAARAA